LGERKILDLLNVLSQGPRRTKKTTR